MIISVLLTLAFVFLFIYGLGQKSKSRAVGSVIYIISIVGMILVWFPDFTTLIAHKVGVGRGADLIFYIFIVISFVVMFSLYLKLTKLSYSVTVLARRIAIDNPVSEGRLAKNPGNFANGVDFSNDG